MDWSLMSELGIDVIFNELLIYVFVYLLGRAKFRLMLDISLLVYVSFIVVKYSSKAVEC